ncbi:MAG: biopolymer transporter ExbD [Cyanobacteriota bacterium]|nr:biopolymer transporter ExbD [Cyanobacteriota bacterium]
MRFKNQQQRQTEEINLVPMMDVLMSILTFFILLSMILTGALEGVDVRLPSDEAGAAQSDAPPPLIVKIDGNNGILVGEQPVEREQLLEQIKGHLAQNPKNSAVLVADPEANYEKVVQLLAEMRNAGGDRVSLGIQGE